MMTGKVITTIGIMMTEIDPITAGASFSVTAIVRLFVATMTITLEADVALRA